jgi:hypothetical protein
MSDAGRIASPFRDTPSFKLPDYEAPRLVALASPFVQAFAFESSSVDADADGDRRALLMQLYDEELDDALYELAGEAAAFASNGVGGESRAGALNAHFAPLVNEIEAFIEKAAETLGARASNGWTESEIDEVLSRIDSERPLPPEFDQFFSKLKNVVSRVAKTAVGVASKFGLGPILAKLKGLVRPLIQNVLKRAINRLPPSIRPAATMLASKLPSLFGKEAADARVEPSFDIAGIQSEFNEQVADLLLADTEAQLHREASNGHAAPEYEAGMDDLDAGRERFVFDLEQLGDGEDPSPAVERFIPALLPALKIGIKIAGRKRVVDMLAKLVAKLIGRLVGPAARAPLSAAVVDTGLKLLGLEVSDADLRRTASAAIAGTVEETVREVAALSDETFDNEGLLEGAIVQAFEAAAASNLPAVLPDAVYRERPELAETDSREGMWIPMPIRGPRRYKKFSRVMKTRITPHAALKIPTFGGATLAQYTQEQLGLEAGADIEADVHLYEAEPGTHLVEVAHLESRGNGAANIGEFHPLTPEAAALLLREPGLARSSAKPTYDAARQVAAGQRVFRIVVPGRKIAAVPAVGTRRERRRRTGVYTVLDFRKGRITVYVFVSERRAQQLAAQLRKQGHAGTVATSLRDFIDRGIASATAGAVTGKVRLIHERLTIDEARGGALGRLPHGEVGAFASRIGEWVLSTLTSYLASQSARVIAATEDTKDGVTFVFTLIDPPGMAALRKALGGSAAKANETLAGSPTSVQVDVVPGFTNG